MLRQLTKVGLSFSHIRWLCANEAEIVTAQAQAESDKVEWEALVETAEVLVESVADQPQSARIEPAHHSADNHSPLGPTYIGIAGTFINVQPANRLLQAKAAIIFTNQRMTVSQGRSVLLNKRYVGIYLSVSELSRKLFSCARRSRCH